MISARHLSSLLQHDTQHATVVKMTREMKVDLTRRQVKKFHFPIVLLHIYKTLLLGRALHFSRLISLSIGFIVKLYCSADPDLNQDAASLRCCLHKWSLYYSLPTNRSLFRV